MILEHIQTVLFACMEFHSCNIFLSVFLERRSKENLLLDMILWIVVCGMEVLYTKYLKDYLAIKIIVGICIYTICMIFRFQGSVIKVFLCVVGYFSIWIISESILVILSNLIIENCSFVITYKDIHITLITSITKSVEVILLTEFRQIFSKEKIFYELGSREWIYFSLFWFCDIFIMLVLGISEEFKSKIILVVALNLLVVNVVFYFVMWESGIKRKENQEYRLIKERAEEQLKQYKKMEIWYKEQRKIVHDFKSHMRYIQGLLEENPQNAKDYIDNIYEKMQKENSPIRTGNSVVDIIVGQKYYEAKTNNVTFVLNLEKLDNLNIYEEDMIILLSNLLDNAIEACVKLECIEDRIVKLTMTRKKKQFFIVVANRVNEENLIKDGIIETTKKDKQYHGIGMYNIQEVVQKYDAYGKCRYEKGWFIYTIVFSWS